MCGAAKATLLSAGWGSDARGPSVATFVDASMENCRLVVVAAAAGTGATSSAVEVGAASVDEMSTVGGAGAVVAAAASAETEAAFDDGARATELRRNSWSMASRAVMRLSGSSSRQRRNKLSNRS